MRVTRSLLLAVTELASPALGTAKNLVPGLSHFWFDGDTLTAFNDILGIRVAFLSDFTGGVEGERLLGILKNSTAKNVTLEARTERRREVLSVEIGSVVVTLPLRPVTESLFHEQFPDDIQRECLVDKPFIDKIKLVMLSCGNKKLASPAERGVTIIQGKSHVDAYATDEVTVSWVRLDNCAVMLPGRVIWPRDFCDYLVRYFGDGTRVFVTEDAVWCQTAKDSDGYNVTVYARLIEDNTPSDFAAFVGRYKDAVAVAFKIPGDLSKALLRAEAMLPEKASVELEVTEVTGDDGDVRVLRLYSDTATGVFDDMVELDGAAGHAELRVLADVKLIRRALSGRTSLAITGGCVVLTGPEGFFHFIANQR